VYPVGFLLQPPPDLRTIWIIVKAGGWRLEAGGCSTRQTWSGLGGAVGEVGSSNSPIEVGNSPI
jgi:hypothetical protein